MSQKLDTALNTLTKWRRVFTAQLMGKSWLFNDGKDPAEISGTVDIFERLLLLRVENSALVHLMLEKKLITLEEFEDRLAKEALTYSEILSKIYPGFRASETGMALNPSIAIDTMAGWRD